MSETIKERQRTAVQQRRILADWKGFVDWLVGVTPRPQQSAAREAIEALPQRDRRAAKAAVLALLPNDTDPAVAALIQKPGPADHLVE